MRKLALLLSFVFCSLTLPASGQDLTQASLDAQRALWDAGDWNHYQFSYQASCFCFGDLVRPARVEVLDGQVVQAIDEDFQVPLDVSVFKTVDQLFDDLQWALDFPAETLNVDFDFAAGYPTNVFYDLDVQIADEEFSYRTSNLTGDVIPFVCDEACRLGQIDGLIDSFGSFSERYDLNDDFVVDIDDLRLHLEREQIPLGDANVDGRFDSSDLVAVFDAGEFRDELRGNSTWGTGDWNADREFDTSDLVAAFQQGRYESGVAAVPEPNGGALLLVGLLGLVRIRR